MDESDAGAPSADLHLAAIKQREQNVKDAIRRGEPMVDMQNFFCEQIGLKSVVADEWGRLWRIDKGRLTLVFSPVWFRIRNEEMRSIMTWCGEPVALADVDALMGAAGLCGLGWADDGS